jgi:poly-gamma-glutamate system protein
MKNCIEHLKEERFGNEEVIDNINDPNETGVIGQQFTEITSGRGSLPINLSTTNPNFAAAVVQLFKDAGLKKGDKVAMSFTGSFPAVNIAICAAVDVLEIQPILIMSITSSSWGANDPEFTWLDMQHSLFEKGLVSFMPVACSIGGNEDVGMTLSQESRRLAEVAIERNKIPYINEGGLKENVAKRMEIFRAISAKHIKLYVNAGEGIASFGSSKNATAIPTGLSKSIKVKNIPDNKGTLYQMVLEGVPVLNFLNQRRILNKYELPIDPIPLPKVGEGQLYSALRYDLRIVAAATAILCGLLIAIAYMDKKQNKLGGSTLSNSETI